MTSKNILLTASLIGLSISSHAQMVDRSKLPTDAPAPQIKIGKPATFSLPNGLKVFVVENHKLPRVAFNLVLDREPILEGDKAGYVDIAGQLMRSGTKTRTKEQLDEAVDFIGANLSTSPTGAYGLSLTKHTPKLLALMADVILNPSFPQAELDKIKKQTKSGLAAQKDNPNAIVGKVSSVVMFGKNHPYGEQSTEATVDRVTVADCQTYYNTYFRPNIGYLAVVGDITPAEARTQIEKALGSWQRGDVPKPTYAAPVVPSKTKIAIVDRPASVQSVINIVYPVQLKPYSSETILASVTNDILGGGEARLFNNLREKHGYTYGAYSNLSGDRLVGRFRASASVRTAVTDSAVAEFMNELKAIGSGRVTADELKQTKNGLSGGFVFSLEDPQTIANFAINTARYSLPDDFFANYLKSIDAATDADVETVAKKFVKPENAYIVVVGKASEFADKLKKYGDIEYYDTDGNKVAAPTPVKAAPAGLTAEQVIDNYIKAIGGKEAVSKIADVSMTMSTEMQGQALQITRKQKGPNRFSMAINAMGMEVMKQTSDGTKVAQSGMQGSKTIEGQEAKASILTGSLFPELHFAENGVKSTLTGTEKVAGKDAYKIVHTTGDGITWSDFYDVTTGLKTQTMITQKAPTGDVVVTVIYSDYQEANGVKFPRTLNQNLGPVQMALKVDQLDVNKGLKDSDF